MVKSNVPSNISSSLTYMGKSFKNALMGRKKTKYLPVPPKVLIEKNSCPISYFVNVSKNVYNPKTNKVWIDWNTIGTIHEGYTINEIKKRLMTNGVELLARLVGGLKVLLTFYDQMAMEILLEDYVECFDQWLVNLVLYDYKKVHKEFWCWVKLE